MQWQCALQVLVTRLWCGGKLEGGHRMTVVIRPPRTVWTVETSCENHPAAFRRCWARHARPRSHLLSRGSPSVSLHATPMDPSFACCDVDFRSHCRDPGDRPFHRISRPMPSAECRACSAGLKAAPATTTTTMRKRLTMVSTRARRCLLRAWTPHQSSLHEPLKSSKSSAVHQVTMTTSLRASQVRRHDHRSIPVPSYPEPNAGRAKL